MPGTTGQELPAPPLRVWRRQLAASAIVRASKQVRGAAVAGPRGCAGSMETPGSREVRGLDPGGSGLPSDTSPPVALCGSARDGPFDLQFLHAQPRPFSAVAAALLVVTFITFIIPVPLMETAARWSVSVMVPLRPGTCEFSAQVTVYFGCVHSHWEELSEKGKPLPRTQSACSGLSHPPRSKSLTLSAGGEAFASWEPTCLLQKGDILCVVSVVS